jgi:hypothetical protein
MSSSPIVNRKKFYRVKAGTLAKAKRDGERTWKPIETTRDLVFDAIYDRDLSLGMVVFWKSRWVLTVKWSDVEEVAV